MKMIYISHPFTGDEANNRKKAQSITKTLAQNCKEVLFVNPLETLQALNDTGHTYEAVMEQAVELMSRCDEVIFCNGWQESRGCNQELREAKHRGMPCHMGTTEFLAEYFKKQD